jgi:hypothetical protein
MSTTLFKIEDYNSGDGMLTSVWGPPLWHVLHTMSFNYPVKPTKEQQKYYFDFFNDLKNVLPCKYCRDNYCLNLEKLPITKLVLKNRENFSKWLYNLHEEVNNNLGKKSGLTFDEVRDRYEHFRSRCLTDPKNKKIITNKNTEKGCTEPLYGIKSKCTLNIVPKNKKTNSFNIDKKCKLIRK